MRKLAEKEMLIVKDLLEFESNALIQVKAAEALVTNSDLKANIDSAIIATENRVKYLQQFINENHIMGNKEMH